MKSGLRFLAILGTVALLTSVALHVGGIFINTLGCELRDFREGEYLSTCSHPVYQDYEHGALFFDLEPSVVMKMRAAKVLFLGSSRTQAGWHTSVLQQHLSNEGVSFYMLGFGFDEKMPFAKALIERYRLSPAVLVINADPFFVNRTSAASRPILERGFESRPGYLYRRGLSEVMKQLCSHDAGLRATRFCTGNRLTTMRNREDGTWRVPNWYNFEKDLVTYTGGPVSKRDEDAFFENATTFMENLDIPRSCVILTAVPSNVSSKQLVERLSARLDTEHVFPIIEGLKTYEGLHLQLESARRWSQAFFAEANDILHRCTSSSTTMRLPG